MLCIKLFLHISSLFNLLWEQMQKPLEKYIVCIYDKYAFISRQQVQRIFRFSLRSRGQDPVFSKPTWNRSPSVLLPIWGENTGGNRFHAKAIESSERVRGRPAHSSTNICQRGTMSQRPGGRHTSCRVSSQPEWARHTLCLISLGDCDHYPVGHPLAGPCGRQRAGLRSWSFASCQRSISILGRDKQS